MKSTWHGEGWADAKMFDDSGFLSSEMKNDSNFAAYVSQLSDKINVVHWENYFLTMLH